MRSKTAIRWSVPGMRGPDLTQNTRSTRERQSVRRTVGIRSVRSSKRRIASAIASASAVIGSEQRLRNPLSTHVAPSWTCPTTAHPPARVREHQDASKARRRGALLGCRLVDGMKDAVFRICLRLASNNGFRHGKSSRGSLERGLSDLQTERRMRGIDSGSVGVLSSKPGQRIAAFVVSPATSVRVGFGL